MPHADEGRLERKFQNLVSILEVCLALARNDHNDNQCQGFCSLKDWCFGPEPSLENEYRLSLSALFNLSFCVTHKKAKTNLSAWLILLAPQD